MSDVEELVEQLKEIFDSYIPKHPVEIYDAKTKEWKSVIYRPIFKSTVQKMIEALTRSRFGPEISEKQKEYGRKYLFSIDSAPDCVDIVFYTEGGYLLTTEPRTVVHAFVHANLIGKMGIANDVAKAEVEYYKTGDESFLLKSNEIYSYYHEFDEVVAKTMEAVFFDFIGDEDNLDKILKDWNVYMKTAYRNKSRYKNAFVLYNIYTHLGLSHFLEKIERLMLDGKRISFIP